MSCRSPLGRRAAEHAGDFPVNQKTFLLSAVRDKPDTESLLVPVIWSPSTIVVSDRPTNCWANRSPPKVMRTVGGFSFSPIRVPLADHRPATFNINRNFRSWQSLEDTWGYGTRRARVTRTPGYFNVDRGPPIATTRQKHRKNALSHLKEWHRTGDLCISLARRMQSGTRGPLARQQLSRQNAGTCLAARSLLLRDPDRCSQN